MRKVKLSPRDALEIALTLGQLGAACFLWNCIEFNSFSLYGAPCYIDAHLQERMKLYDEFVGLCRAST